MGVIAVCGAGAAGPELCRQAEAVGRLIAEKGHFLVCGGLGGIMEAAARGAKEAGGVTIALLPGEDLAEANPYIDHPLPTGLGIARNALVVRAGRGVIAVEGGYGTLSELAMALKLGRVVVALGRWAGVEGVIAVSDPEEAVVQLWSRLAR
ncbi:MAG: TIGR00725 family protein [Proteobacteria bacterium]|nr:TIGR00725 family protein [Pseudomonadota bacterium]